MEKRYYKLIILSIALLALVMSGIYRELIVSSSGGIDISNSDNNIEVVVHISGEIETEGVYNLKLGSRIGDLITIAGGIKKDANMENINLAEQLKDGQKINIPSKEAFDFASNQGSKTGEDNKLELLNLEEFNVLGIEELEKLPGIGPVLAKNIYDYRNKNGSFMTVDELINVNGIGEKKLLTIKECFK